MRSKDAAIGEALSHIFQGIEVLKTAYPNRKFTIDGRLVGDIGEVLAALEYEITLDDVSRADYDARTLDGSEVQIKATFGESLTFKRNGGLFLGLKLSREGGFEEIFNGPARLIFERYSHRKGIGSELLSFPISELRELSKKVPESERIPNRKTRSKAV